MKSLVLLVFFFFSSRRRHTRSLCDWSSDVCSSDLVGDEHGRGGAGPDRVRHQHTVGGGCGRWPRLLAPERSEERRVGKEGRARGSAAQSRKKTGCRNRVDPAMKRVIARATMDARVN